MNTTSYVLRMGLGLMIALLLLVVDWRAGRYLLGAAEIGCATVMLAGVLAVLANGISDSSQLPDAYVHLLNVAWVMLMAICMWRVWEMLSRGRKPPAGRGGPPVA